MSTSLSYSRIARSASRRRFLGTGTAGFSALMLAACSSSNNANNSSNSNSTTSSGSKPAATVSAAAGGATAATAAPAGSPAVASGAGQPKRGGVLNGMTYQEPADWRNFGKVSDSATLGAYTGLWSYIIHGDPYNGNKLTGDIASSWETPDPTHIVFHIRPDAKWHTGEPVTADDVAYSLQRQIDMKGIVASGLATVSGVQKVDASNVTVTLSRPSATVLQAIGSDYIPVFPASTANNADPTKVPGSGPYRLKSRTANVSLEWERNPAYHVAGLPYLDGVSVKVIVDQTAKEGAAMAKQLDWVFPSMGDTPKQNQFKSLGYEVSLSPSYRWTMGFKNEAPFTDDRVRQAFNLAINRQDLAKLIFKGDSWIGGYMIPPAAGGLWGLTPEDINKLPGYRPDKSQDMKDAKQLLDAAGGLQNLGLTNLEIYTRDLYQDPTVALASLLKQWLGINATVKADTTGPFQSALGSGNFRVFFASFLGQYDDPAEWLTPFFQGGTARNYGGFTFASMDDLAAKQDSAPNSTERASLIHQQDLMGLGTNVLLHCGWGTTYGLQSSRVRNFPSTGDTGDRLRFEKVWLA